MLRPNHQYDFSFLFWAHPTRQNDRSLVNKVDELAPQRIISKYFDQAIPSHDDTHLLALFSDIQVLLVLCNTNLFIDIYCLGCINNVLV